MVVRLDASVEWRRTGYLWSSVETLLLNSEGQNIDGSQFQDPKNSLQ